MGFPAKCFAFHSALFGCGELEALPVDVVGVRAKGLIAELADLVTRPDVVSAESCGELTKFGALTPDSILVGGVVGFRDRTVGHGAPLTRRVLRSATVIGCCGSVLAAHRRIAPVSSVIANVLWCSRGAGAQRRALRYAGSNIRRRTSTLMKTQKNTWEES